MPLLLAVPRGRFSPSPLAGFAFGGAIFLAFFARPGRTLPSGLFGRKLTFTVRRAVSRGPFLICYEPRLAFEKVHTKRVSPVSPQETSKMSQYRFLRTPTQDANPRQAEDPREGFHPTIPFREPFGDIPFYWLVVRKLSSLFLNALCLRNLTHHTFFTDRAFHGCPSVSFSIAGLPADSENPTP